MRPPYPHPVIAREGWPFLAAAVAAALLVGIFAGGWWSAPLWLGAAFVLQFFRDPAREVPDDPRAVVSPADGRVVAVQRARDPWLERDALKISVFMNVFNVHSNRSPVDGTVRRRWYHAGRFVNAALDKASLENERNALALRTPGGADVTCVQIAGLVARRILCYVEAGAALQRGQRFGFIRFGSRVDVYLPNLFTTAALFAGFYAIVQAMNGRFGESAIAIFIAGLLDGLDGRVARLTRTQSEFGAEYDSLSDMVSFGAAPALVLYEWALKDLGRFGWIAAFVYCAGAALRLARFNVMIDVVDKRFFQGLPSPAAAALVAGFVWLAHDNKIPLDAYNLQWVAAFVALYGGLTMVSNVPFYSFKDINFRKSVPFWAMLLIVLGFVLVSSDPPIVLFLLFCAYGLSGYVMWALGKRPRPRP